MFVTITDGKHGKKSYCTVCSLLIICLYHYFAVFWPVKRVMCVLILGVGMVQGFCHQVAASVQQGTTSL